MEKTPERQQPVFDVGYAGQQYRQSRIGLEMTPAQRLAWLERKKVEMQRLLGKARNNPKK